MDQLYLVLPVHEQLDPVPVLLEGDVEMIGCCEFGLVGDVTLRDNEGTGKGVANLLHCHGFLDALLDSGQIGEDGRLLLRLQHVLQLGK